MSHSVRRHLRLDIAEYDETIRRFIPGYEEMLATAAREVTAGDPRTVLELGAGTGALAEVVLSAGGSTVALLDVDAEMLARARTRLERYGPRARFLERSFFEPLPGCDAACASLALHHVPTLDRKSAVYRAIFDTLPPGGVFVNADPAMPATGSGRDAAYRAWADHLVASGIEEPRAWEHFEEWSEEDTYFSLETELAALRQVGFRAECVWERGPIKVLVGVKPQPAAQTGP